MARAMVHQNSSILGSIAIETNGPNPLEHDIIEVCVLILDSDFKPNRKYLPFNLRMIPPNPGNADYKNMRMNKVEYYKLLQNSLEHDRIADLFEEWYNRLGLRLNKGIMPVVYDWQNIYPFLQKWLGFEHTKFYFHPQVRDLHCATVYENDKSAYHVDQTPFPKVDLQYITSVLRIERKRPHNPMQDCIVVPKCFRRVMKEGAHVLKVRDEDVGEWINEVSDMQLERSFDPRDSFKSEDLSPSP